MKQTISRSKSYDIGEETTELMAVKFRVPKQDLHRENEVPRSL